MNKIKTDIEIAADAIKYCRRELKKYNDLLAKYYDEYEKQIFSKRTIAMWEYEKQKLEYVLGLSDRRSIYPFSKEEVLR